MSRALLAYRERRWDAAEGHLEEAQGLLGLDRPCQVLLERIARFRLNPPPSGWDGSAILEHK